MQYSSSVKWQLLKGKKLQIKMLVQKFKLLLLNIYSNNIYVLDATFES